jgi:hypothetical protein
MSYIVPQELLKIPFVEERFQEVLRALRSADLHDAQADALWDQAWQAVEQPHPAAQLRDLQALLDALHPLCAMGKAVPPCLA